MKTFLIYYIKYVHNIYNVPYVIEDIAKLY